MYGAIGRNITILLSFMTTSVLAYFWATEKLHIHAYPYTDAQQIYCEIHLGPNCVEVEGELDSIIMCEQRRRVGTVWVDVRVGFFPV